MSSFRLGGCLRDARCLLHWPVLPTFKGQVEHIPQPPYRKEADDCIAVMRAGIALCLAQSFEKADRERERVLLGKCQHHSVHE